MVIFGHLPMAKTDPMPWLLFLKIFFFYSLFSPSFSVFPYLRPVPLRIFYMETAPSFFALRPLFFYFEYPRAS